MEKDAIEKIVNLLPSEAQRDEIMSLYLEYENKSTEEARWVYYQYRLFYVPAIYGQVKDIGSMTTFNSVF